MTAEDGTGGETDDDGTGPAVADTAGELAAELEALREELRRERRGPFGLPRPPRPGELLRFADEHAIPFAVAVLEANIRALELLQGAIRLAESGRRAGADAEAARDRARSLGRASLERLDDVLADLEAAATNAETPPDDAAADIVAEARRLRQELADALDTERPPEADDAAEADGRAETTARPDAETAGSGPADPSTAAVDVEGELESIKRELGEMEDGPAESDGGPAQNGSESGDEAS